MPNISGKQMAVLITGLFFGALGLSIWLNRLPLVVPVLYACASVITFVAYALDKSAARRNRWRTKENTLQLISMLGGWPGALLAQQFIRHKTRKQWFQFVFWLSVVLNCLILAWIISLSGRPNPQ